MHQEQRGDWGQLEGVESVTSGRERVASSNRDQFPRIQLGEQ